MREAQNQLESSADLAREAQNRLNLYHATVQNMSGGGSVRRTLPSHRPPFHFHPGPGLLDPPVLHRSVRGEWEDLAADVHLVLDVARSTLALPVLGDDHGERVSSRGHNRLLWNPAGKPPMRRAQVIHISRRNSVILPKRHIYISTVEICIFCYNELFRNYRWLSDIAPLQAGEQLRASRRRSSKRGGVNFIIIYEIVIIVERHPPLSLPPQAGGEKKNSRSLFLALQQRFQIFAGNAFFVGGDHFRCTFGHNIAAF